MIGNGRDRSDDFNTVEMKFNRGWALFCMRKHPASPSGNPPSHVVWPPALGSQTGKGPFKALAAKRPFHSCTSDREEMERFPLAQADELLRGAIRDG